MKAELWQKEREMAQHTLEERVRTLEETVAELVAVANASRQKRDWQSTVGIFKDDPIIAEIQEEGRKLREAERRAAQRDAEP